MSENQNETANKVSSRAQSARESKRVIATASKKPDYVRYTQPAQRNCGNSNNTKSHDKEYQHFHYEEREDYDKTVRVNGDPVRVYSRKQMKKLYPFEDYEVIGETYPKKKRNKKRDIGSVEVNEQRLNVSEPGFLIRIFKKQGTYMAVRGGNYIAFLKNRILPIFLLIAILLSGIGIGGYVVFGPESDDDHGIKPIPATVLTISGTVTAGGSPAENATLSLQSGNDEVAAATTDKDGKYLINDVKKGVYNLVCTYGKSSLTKMAEVEYFSIEIDFDFGSLTGDDTAVNAVVKIVDDNTPPISVSGLAEEAVTHTLNGQRVDLTLLAKKFGSGDVPTEAQTAIADISGAMEKTYYDFNMLKEVYQNESLTDSEYLSTTGSVLEIAIPFDASRSVDTRVFRYDGSTANELTSLENKPTGNYQDGTYYVTTDTVYLYVNCFAGYAYAIGAANDESKHYGSDVITYSGNATLNLKTKEITLLYKHDADSTNDAKIQIYLVGENSNLLIAESAAIPVGYQIESVKLKDNVKNLPSVGTYEGLMKIIYLNTDGSTSTNVDIPLSVAIVK